MAAEPSQQTAQSNIHKNMNTNSQPKSNAITPAGHNPVKPGMEQSDRRTVSRRGFLGAMPKVVTGAAVGAGVLGMTPGTQSEAQAQLAPQLPWPYQQLNPQQVAERAYAGFYVKGCMYGVFEGIIGELRQLIGAPYTTFPVLMMEYGKGGINGTWGTLCGTLNGAAAAINLVSPAPRALIDELFYWYNQETLPNYRPATPRHEIVPSVSKSPICHASVQRWCEASGLPPTSPQRAERCGWLTASVAKFVAEQLNKQTTGTFTAVHERPADPRHCMECHTTIATKKVDHGKNMDCAQCHSDLDELHWYPSRHLQLRWTGGGTLEQADSINGPWTVAPNQYNPQAIPLNTPLKFYRTKR